MLDLCDQIFIFYTYKKKIHLLSFCNKKSTICYLGKNILMVSLTDKKKQDGLKEKINNA